MLECLLSGGAELIPSKHLLTPCYCLRASKCCPDLPLRLATTDMLAQLTCNEPLWSAVRSADVYPGGKKDDFEKGDNSKGPFEKVANERRLEFHSDQGATDLIALLSVNKAKSGGESKWVSAVAIHNELLRRGRKVCLPHSHFIR